MDWSTWFLAEKEPKMTYRHNHAMLPQFELESLTDEYKYTHV